MKSIPPIHPFPARMAPEIVLRECSTLEKGSIILDPMMGSGTVLRVAAEHNHRGQGFDLDPLAVLITKVWTSVIDLQQLSEVSAAIINEARGLAADEIVLPWIDDDEETKSFISFWFGAEQIADLRRVSFAVSRSCDAVADALRVALSRLIITKDRGASLARDVSHSRPHRVRDHNDFSVLDEYPKSVNWLIKKLKNNPPPGNVQVNLGDARKLESLQDESVDSVITSPPYLNAIDYLRGHRLSLVWLGYRISQLRAIRTTSIGAEHGPSKDADLKFVEELLSEFLPLDVLPRRERRILSQYLLDLTPMVREMHRVLRNEGKIVFAVGNSCLRGVFIENASFIDRIATITGLTQLSRGDRTLPSTRRYLPPPAGPTDSDLNKRMATETVLTYVKH